MRIRFLVATSITALAVVACSSVVNGKGTLGSPGPVGPTSVVPTAPTPTPSVTGFPPPSSSSVPTPTLIPPPTLSTSPFPSVTSTPPVGQEDFKCPYVVYPHAHLSFVCVETKMKSSTKDKVWPLVERHTVQHKPVTWTLDTGAGHWGPAGSDSLRDIAIKVRDAMVSDEDYGNPAPTVRTNGKQIQVGGHQAYQLVSTFGINPAFRQQSGAKVRREKSWIVAIQIAPNDVSLWYVSVPDLVKYYWPLVDSLISTISVN